MKVLFTGRGFEIKESIKRTIQERVEKLRKYLDDIIEVHAFLTVEKYRHRAEVTVQTRRHKLASTAVSADMYLSVTSVFAKLEIQARKVKEKRKDGKRLAAGKRVSVIEPTLPAEPSDTKRIIRVNNFNLKPMSVEDAVMRMDMDKIEFLLFRSTITSGVAVVYRRKDGNIGLIEPEI